MPDCHAVLCHALLHLQGLDYLHRKSMVHFDLKSPNLLVTVRDKVPCVKLADMGLVKARTRTYVSGEQEGLWM